MKPPACDTALVAVLLGWRVAFASDLPVASEAWARATPPGVSVGAAYVTLDGGSRDDTLVGARLDGVGRVEFHQTTTVDGVARMRPSATVPLPARQRVIFGPAGRHLMLFDLARPLTAGERRTLVLVLERAGEISIDVDVRPAGAPAPGAR